MIVFVLWFLIIFTIFVIFVKQKSYLIYWLKIKVHLSSFLKLYFLDHGLSQDFVVVGFRVLHRDGFRVLVRHAQWDGLVVDITHRHWNRLPWSCVFYRHLLWVLGLDLLQEIIDNHLTWRLLLLLGLNLVQEFDSRVYPLLLHLDLLVKLNDFLHQFHNGDILDGQFRLVAIHFI